MCALFLDCEGNSFFYIYYHINSFGGIYILQIQKTMGLHRVKLFPCGSLYVSHQEQVLSCNSAGVGVCGYVCTEQTRRWFKRPGWWTS